ncbi:MAG: formate dehydrogenase subunit delta [Steroidobacteraceae bacterium]|nr:formate dehydrogenase subunit delta [Steroidobacteraceae bacterium]
MGDEHLVKMVNEIAAFFHAASDDPASDVAAHLKRFWNPRMRQRIVEYVRGDGAGLTPLARAAVELLEEQAKPVRENP